MPNHFYVNKYTDADLQALLEAVQHEMTARKQKRARAREEWVYRYANEAYHRGAKFEVVGETVVLAFWNNGHILMSKTTPIKGDVFDVDTGIAVAYAKAKGLRVPDFI